MKQLVIEEQRVFLQAVEEVKEGNINAAIDSLRRVLDGNPRHAEANQELGILYVKQGNATAALPLLKVALECKPQQLDRWLRYADALNRAGHGKSAVSIIAQARKQGLKGDLLDNLEAQIRRVLDFPALDFTEIVGLLDKGSIDEAEARAKSYLSSHPNHPRVHYYLALALYHKGSYDAAVEHARNSAAILAQDVNAHNLFALSLKKAGRLDDALQAFQKALILAPHSPAIYANIGSVYNQKKEYDQALAWLNKGLALDSSHKSLRANKAITLLETDEITEAENLVKSLLDEGYKNLSTLETMARICEENGDLEMALNYFDQAIQAGAKSASTLIFKANALVDTGRFADAEQTYSEALRIDPSKLAALAGIARSRKMTKADISWLRQATDALAKDGVSLEEAMNLEYAIGKYFSDLANHNQSFFHHAQANTLKQKAWQDCRYDRTNQERLVDALIAHYDESLFSKWRESASQELRPLFIVGMPRSGTSLTEQILASHPSIYGAGELKFWARLAENDKPRVLKGEFDVDWLHRSARDCLDYLHARSADAARVVDKMPGNFLWVGLIHTVFPNARILHTMRNPVDNGLSIFFQNFNKGHAYANSLEDIADYYRQYHKLMAHWRKVIPPDRFLELPYEQLVEDQEGWTRRIMDFIGLDFDDRMLEFYKTERKVGTASNWQARQPIYKTSKERWRSYEKHVGPLLPLLELYDPERGQI